MENIKHWNLNLEEHMNERSKILQLISPSANTHLGHSV